MVIVVVFGMLCRFVMLSWCSVAQASVVVLYTMRRGAARRVVMWRGLAWPGLAWPGLAWPGVMCGTLPWPIVPCCSCVLFIPNGGCDYNDVRA